MSSASSSRGTSSIPGADGKFGRTDLKLVSADNPLGLDRKDPDAKDDITDINQLNIPVDRPVLVHLSSKDVIHSFGLYEMRVKQDAIPGLEMPVWFIPTVTTDDMRSEARKADFDYEITCSQLCGLGHYRMRGFVTVQTRSRLRQVDGRPGQGARAGTGATTGTSTSRRASARTLSASRASTLECLLRRTP